MTKTTTIAGRGAWLAAGLLAAWAAFGQPPAGDVTDATAFDPEIWRPRAGVYLGSGGCTNSLCHGAAGPQESERIRGDEHTVWLKDPHREAFATLETPAAMRMARALGLARPTASGLCLDCHTVHVPAEARDGLSVTAGISCEGCHGAAGGWLVRHDDPAWTHADSVGAGLIDLRDLTVRTRLCARCHLGTGGRAVDHRLIAAGHPEPRFELDNLTGGLPRHWRLAGEDPDRGDETDRGVHGVPAWAVGQAASLAASLTLLAEQAAGDGPWPELSHLSCRSCHHDLDAGWRRQRGYAFRGGQPPWSPARWLVLRVLGADLAPDLTRDMAQRIDALGARLSDFAPRGEVERLARDLVPRAERLAGVLGEVAWTAERVRRVIRDLAGDRDRLVAADVATAEQVYWALRSLVAFLTASDAGREPVDGPLARGLDRLYADLRDPNAFDRARFHRHLADVARAAR